MVMFRSISFLNRIVWTPEIALTTVDFPCATCPIVPIFMVACLPLNLHLSRLLYLEITSGDVGVKVDGSISTFSIGVSST